MRCLAATLALAAALCGPLQAQTSVKIGTNTGAPTYRYSMADLSNTIGQTFTARGSYLTGFSFWFYGGTLDSPEGAFFTQLDISGAGGASIFWSTLDQGHRGRYDFSFDPIRVVFGSTYWIEVLTSNCDGEPDVLDRCPVPVTGEFTTPSVEVTTIDAYRAGDFIDGNNMAIRDADIRFRATFLTPEPGISSCSPPVCWVLVRRAKEIPRETKAAAPITLPPVVSHREKEPVMRTADAWPSSPRFGPDPLRPRGRSPWAPTRVRPRVGCI